MIEEPSMAYRPIADFLPIGLDRTPVQAVPRTSAIEFLSRRVQMSSSSVRVPALGTVDSDVIPRGEFYPEDTTADATVLLELTKFGQAVPVTDEDLGEASRYYNAQDALGTAWANSAAVQLDTGAIGCTAGPGVPETTVPFTSIYYAVSHNATGYTANANKVALAASALD